MSSYLPDPDLPPDAYENCPGFLERYLDYLGINLGRRPRTQSDTLLILREMCQYVHYINKYHSPPPTHDAHKDMGIYTMEVCELAAVSQDDLDAYVCFLDAKANNSSSTIRKKLSIIRQFYRYLYKMQGELGIVFPNGDPSENVMRPLDRPHAGGNQLLTPRELQRMINTVSGVSALRDKAILLLLCTTGVSLAEASTLDREDADGERWIRVGRPPRYIYLTKPVRSAIRQYLHELRSLEDSEPFSAPLFLSASRNRSASKGRLTDKTIRDIVIRAGSQAKIGDNITPKVLRQSVREILLEYSGGGADAQILDYLGYKVNARIRRDDTLPRKNEMMKALVEDSPLGELNAE